MRPDAQVDLHVECLHRPGQTRDDLSIATRDALTLTIDRPIVATGHQAALHHGGIVAKVMAANALARHHDASDVFLMVDTVPDAVFQARRPVRTDEGWTVQHVQLAQDAAEPLCLRGPADLQEAAELGIDLPRGKPAREQAMALLQWQWSQWSLQPGLCNASDLLDTPGPRHVLELMAKDPHTCNRLLGKAIRASGVHDVRVPAAGDDPELPLWATSTAGGLKRRVARASDLDSADVELHPQAVLTTLLMRRFVCDLFIHGTGGARYDRITEAWAEAWLECPLASAALVTADVRLGGDDLVASRAALHQALAGIRRTRHDIGAPVDGAPSTDKARLLAAIDAQPIGSKARHNAFAQMHATLLDGVDARLAQPRTYLDVVQRSVDVLSARDWPLVWLPPGRATALRELVEAAC